MPQTDVYDYTDKLIELLSKEKKIVDISCEFKKINENGDRVRYLTVLLKTYNLIGDDGVQLKLGKSSIIAESCRSEGNKFYTKRKFVDALKCYNQSLCFAELGTSDWGLVYANKSAVYFELKIFLKSLENIELAKKNWYPAENFGKLSKRKAMCEEAIEKKIKQTSAIAFGQKFLKLSYKPNKKLPFIAECLEMRSSEVFGRYIITNVDLKPGDIIAIEEPFTKCLLPEHSYVYCANCLRDNFMDLVPCFDCTSTMFCSEECRTLGMRKFHKFECAVIDQLNNLSTKILRIAVRTFFEALEVCGGSLKELNTLIEENDATRSIFDFEHPLTRREVLQAIDALASNESTRTQSDLFQRAGIVALVTNLLISVNAMKDLLITESDVAFFRSFVFKQTQISASNYHGIYNGIFRASEIDLNPQHGSGSYPFCSLLNHSCAPNVVRISHEGKIVVTVNRVIAAGGQIFDNYGFHHCLEDVKKRRTSLFNQYMFNCVCEACRNNYSLFTELPRVEPKLENFLSNDIRELSELNVQHAEDRFNEYCRYLQKLGNQYPCWEISSLQECLLRCFTIFTMSEFKLKLCEK